MELTYPLIIYIGVLVLAVTFLITFISVRKYKGGRKLADAELVREIPYYKWLLIRFSVLKFLMTLSLIVSILLALFIASKPVEVRTTVTEHRSRDIMLCLDTSASLDGPNLELCDQLKKFVKKLNGERFGVTIFVGKSILLVPMTSDYDYVIEVIDNLESSIRQAMADDYVEHIGHDEKLYYRFSGTLIDGGSSLVGDGLVSALYNFPDLKDDPERARLIVFMTDNDVEGEQLVTLEEACILCAKYNVKVFAIAPDNIVNEHDFENSIYITGGDYYNSRDKKAMNELMEAVKKTDSNVEYVTSTKTTDVPEKAMIALIISLCLYFVCAWRIKL